MKKVLIVRLSALGDVIFTIPLANALKNAGYIVDWVVSEKGYELLKGNPCVNNVILAPIEKWRKSKNLWQIFSEYLQVIKTLRENKYDISIDCQMILKSFILHAFCGAKRRLIAKNNREFSFLGATEIIPSIVGERHVSQDYLQFAKHLGVDISNVEVTLPELEQSVKDKVDDLLSDIEKSKQFIVICPATTWDTKHWNKDNWKAVIEDLEKDYILIFTGQQRDNELISYIGGDRHLNLAGKTNLKELREVFSRADLVISLDSGSTHLAWATQNPKILSIFCSTPTVKYGPLGDKYISLSGPNLKCQPCHKKKCPLLSNACTYLPSVEDVVNNARKLLSK